MDPAGEEHAKSTLHLLPATLSTTTTTTTTTTKTKIIDRRARVRALIRGATSSGGKEWLTVHLSAELRQIIAPLILAPFNVYISGMRTCTCARARTHT
jgi:hypothetical protein